MFEDAVQKIMLPCRRRRGKEKRYPHQAVVAVLVM